MCLPETADGAGVAQSVEQLIRNQQVVCSSHITSSKSSVFVIEYRAFSFDFLKDAKPMPKDDGFASFLFYHDHRKR